MHDLNASHWLLHEFEHKHIRCGRRRRRTQAQIQSIQHTVGRIYTAANIAARLCSTASSSLVGASFTCGRWAFHEIFALLAKWFWYFCFSGLPKICWLPKNLVPGIFCVSACVFSRGGKQLVTFKREFLLAHRFQCHRWGSLNSPLFRSFRENSRKFCWNGLLIGQCGCFGGRIHSVTDENSLNLFGKKSTKDEINNMTTTMTTTTSKRRKKMWNNQHQSILHWKMKVTSSGDSNSSRTSNDGRNSPKMKRQQPKQQWVNCRFSHWTRHERAVIGK